VSPRADHPASAGPDFIGGLADLWRATREATDVESVLRLVCERGRPLLECDAIIVRVLEGGRLVVRAMEPESGGGPWSDSRVKSTTTTEPEGRRARASLAEYAGRSPDHVRHHELPGSHSPPAPNNR